MPASRSLRFAFIDADNIHRWIAKTLTVAGIEESALSDFDISKLFADHDRCYVYYAKHPVKPIPDWIQKLQATSGFIVRLARATSKNGKLKQEGVDVQMAIEAMQHSFRGTIASCSLFSGDRDFLPLIDALTNNGTFVTVHSPNNPEKGEVAPELRNRADDYRRITVLDLFKCYSDGAFTERSGRIANDRIVLNVVRQVKIDGNPVSIIEQPSDDFPYWVRSSNGEKYQEWGFVNMDDIGYWYLLYCKPNGIELD